MSDIWWSVLDLRTRKTNSIIHVHRFMFCWLSIMSYSLPDVFKKQAIHQSTSASLIKHAIYHLTINNPNSLRASWVPCFPTPIAASQEAARQTSGWGWAIHKSTLGTGPSVEAVNQGWEKVAYQPTRFTGALTSMLHWVTHHSAEELEVGEAVCVCVCFFGRELWV